MAQIDDVKAACDRLAPLGWRSLIAAVTNGGLDIVQPTAAALKAALLKNLPNIQRGLQGFEDFDPAGTQGISPHRPSASLLLHAFASPRVVRDNNGNLLGAFPTMAEIEAVESLVFAIQPRSLAQVAAAAGAGKLAVVTFAVEYRPAPDTAHARHADLTFGRTGVARVGTSRVKYLPEERGYWPEDMDNPNAFRIVPVRFQAWLASQVKGSNATVMRDEIAAGQIDSPQRDAARDFWVPVHKLFDGPECLTGLDLALAADAKFINMKLQKVLLAAAPTSTPKTGFPYVIDTGLADVASGPELGRFAVVPRQRGALVEPAVVNGVPQVYRVPKKASNAAFATFSPATGGDAAGREIRNSPAYVHARTKVVNGQLIDLNDAADVGAEVAKGNYDALLYVDFTGEGWIDISAPQLSGKPQLEAKSRAAYVLLSAPDFFPSAGQRELMAWSQSNDVPGPFRGRVWGVLPRSLNSERLPANIQLGGSPFAATDDTITAVVAMQPTAPGPARQWPFEDTNRASTLSDDAAGEFAPGWDVAIDTKRVGAKTISHLAAYGLGSPFPEDAKLCAALSTFWPAVAPDVYRTMPLHSGNDTLYGTVAPLTDEEIGQTGNLPWDGVTGPAVVTDATGRFVEFQRFKHVDYVTNAVENRFSLRLTARITAREYSDRVLAAARVHAVLGQGIAASPINETRKTWLFLSFRTVHAGDSELQAAQLDAGKVLPSPVYRVEVCHVPTGTQLIPSPKGNRFARIRIAKQQTMFVSPRDSSGLRRREGIDVKFSRVNAE